jgi:hypothetical protein
MPCYTMLTGQVWRQRRSFMLRQPPGGKHLPLPPLLMTTQPSANG